MARNLRHKRKNNKQKVVPKKLLPKYQPTIANANKHGLFLTILSILLTTIGLVALIELFPRLSATATPPLDQGNQLASSKFTVSNDGYLQVTEVMSACFLWKGKSCCSTRKYPSPQ
jgi:hypothetical protein